jgi:hypothetical protein
VSSWAAHQTGEELVGRWVNSKDYWRLRKRRSLEEKSDEEIREMAATEYRMKLARLPTWEKLSEEQCREKVRKYADNAAKLRADAWAAHGEGLTPPGVAEVLEKSILTTTHPYEPIRRRLCLTYCDETREAFFEEYRDAVKRYKEAAERLRRGQDKAFFPRGMIPPGHLHCAGSPGAEAAGENRAEPAADVETAEGVSDEAADDVAKEKTQDAMKLAPGPGEEGFVDPFAAPG